jgi:hypothetical protein
LRSACLARCARPGCGPCITDFAYLAEVTKMIKVYGAPIEDADVARIVDYLATTY